MITEIDLAAATGEPAAASFEVDELDLVTSNSRGSVLSFLDDPKFVELALTNQNIAALLTTREFEEPLSSFKGVLLLVDDPRWYFYSLHNFLAQKTRVLQESVISADSQIAANAHVAVLGVTIGSRVIIEPNVTIMSSVIIQAGSIIRAGAVIGNSGFEHKRTSHGILSVIHDGDVLIEEGVEIGALAVVGKGFARRSTRVGKQSMIDCHVMIAHGSQLGERVFVAAGAVIAGSTTIASDAWIGPGAILIDQVHIGERAHVGLGSVVLRDVKPGGRVLGNPARPIADSTS